MQQAFGYIITWIACQHYATCLIWMLQNPMASPHADLIPAIIAEKLHCLADLHPAISSIIIVPQDGCNRPVFYSPDAAAEMRPLPISSR